MFMVLGRTLSTIVLLLHNGGITFRVKDVEIVFTPEGSEGCGIEAVTVTI